MTVVFLGNGVGPLLFGRIIDGNGGYTCPSDLPWRRPCRLSCCFRKSGAHTRPWSFSLYNVLTGLTYYPSLRVTLEIAAAISDVFLISCCFSSISLTKIYLHALPMQDGRDFPPARIAAEQTRVSPGTDHRRNNNTRILKYFVNIIDEDPS